MSVLIVDLNGVPGLLCKLDLENAYDHMNWLFLKWTPRNG